MPSGGKKKHKKPSRKKSELDSALDQIGDESVAAATEEFQDLLGASKGRHQRVGPAKCRGTRTASRPFKKTKDRQGRLRFLRRKSKTRSAGVCRWPAGASTGTRRKTDATCSGDSCEGGDRIDLAVTADALRTARTTASRLQPRACGPSVASIHTEDRPQGGGYSSERDFALSGSAS